ncbi:hypothetical protein F2Q69_00038460 [Brassica cretica]|uniref:Uncharacterized protein n=1 Tax=Brassica cretica TaxID=69181 RepID=A0A8S9SVI4_BRACR|nr:hypothetical protein F2Q69_00038460 [Brassica cretica]
MEFLKTFECILSSKEVIRVIFGRALPGATSRSDYMKSLCTTSRSDFPRETARSRSRPLVRRHQNRASWSDLPERRAEVAPDVQSTCWSDTPRSLASSRPETPKSSILERLPGATYQGRSQPERPAQSDYHKSLQPERPAQVARVLTGRDTKKRVGSDLLERLC